MQREIQVTTDGSHTLAIPSLGITYHSKHGAVGESRHVTVRKAMQTAGFKIEKIPGPWGKREMVRATK